MKIIPKFIDEKGLYQPQKSTGDLGNQPDSKYQCMMHVPLKHLIENNYVFQDENEDWILVEYYAGELNSIDYINWIKTGYKKHWQVCRWKKDVNQDEISTLYSQETSCGWDRNYFRVELNNHTYRRIIHPNGYWVEKVDRIDNCDQLYYKNAYDRTSGKMPIKIGKKIQELRDQGLEVGFYKF